MNKKKITLEYINFSGVRFSSSQIVYGQQIVEEQLTNALLAYSNNEYMYMYTANDFTNITIKRMQKHFNSSIDIISKTDVLNKKEKYHTDIFHSIGHFDEMLFIRNKCFDKISPISFTLHCASKQSAVLERNMKMLLLPFKSYDSFICTSNSAKTVVEKQLNSMAEKMNSIYGGDVSYKGRLDVIPLGVNTQVFKPLDKKYMRKKYDIPQDDFVILWLGRFSSFDKADLMQLLRVVCKLKSKNQDKSITLVLAGNDNDIFSYVDVIKKNIKLLGIEQNVKLILEYNIYKRNELFCMADVFTSPIDNVQETFGITPIEAMACGVPQIVSDWDGYKDSVLNGVTGFLIPTTWYQYDSGLYDIPKSIGSQLKDNEFIYSHYLTAQSVVLDEEAYINAFQTLIDNPNLLQKMSVNSRALAEERFEWSKIINCYNELWDELLEQSKSYNDNKVIDDQKLDILRMNFYEIFKTYPTHICKENITLYLSDDGKALHESGEAFLSNGKLDHIFTEFNMYKLILEILARNGKMNLFSLAEEIEEFRPEVVKRCVVMLIKRGYIMVEKDRLKEVITSF